METHERNVNIPYQVINHNLPFFPLFPYVAIFQTTQTKKAQKADYLFMVSCYNQEEIMSTSADGTLQPGSGCRIMPFELGKKKSSSQ